MNTTRLGAAIRPPWRAAEIALHALIKEARDRQRRRRMWLLLVAALIVVAVASYGPFRPSGGGGPRPLGASAPGHTPVASSQGVGGVSFGMPRSQAVAQLTRLFGTRSRSVRNTGCGARFGEVEWGHFYAEFRQGRFTGFRYMDGSWLPQQVHSNPPARVVQPRIATEKGVSLGTSLGQVRKTYGPLSLIGTDRWQTSDGLVFYDDALRDPSPASSRIIEIKFGTCGDF
jgi:predicted nucleic acid-binding Zn ribbon protein